MFIVLVAAFGWLPFFYVFCKKIRYMALSGVHYLIKVMPHITREDDIMAIELRKDRTQNTYFGTLPTPYTGLKFSFTWQLVKGSTNLATGSSGRTRIRWVFKFFGIRVAKGAHAVNSAAGQALLLEISVAEAARAEAEDDNPGAGDRQKAIAFRQAITAEEAAGQILPTGGKTLQQLYTEKGI